MESSFKSKKELLYSVSLECSSGLANQLTSHAVRLKFVFSTSQDPLSNTEEYDKIMWCNETSKDGNWIITPQGNTCLLKVINFSLADNGKYGCFMFLPDSYDDDWSNSVSLVSSSDLKPSLDLNNTLGIIVTVIIAIVIGLTVGITLILVTIPGIYFVYKLVRSSGNGGNSEGNITNCIPHITKL